jgi:hypothetical protein
MTKLREISIDLGTEFGLNKKLIIKSVFIYLGVYDDNDGIEEAKLNKENQKIRIDYQLIWFKDDGTIFKKENNNYIQTDEETLTRWDTNISNNEMGKNISDGIKLYINNNIIPNL